MTAAYYKTVTAALLTSLQATNSGLNFTSYKDTKSNLTLDSYPCKDQQAAPVLSFQFARYEYALSNENYISQVEVTNDGNKTNMCVLNIIGNLPADTSQPSMILGSPFVNSFYIQLDSGSMMVGINIDRSATAKKQGKVVDHKSNPINPDDPTNDDAFGKDARNKVIIGCCVGGGLLLIIILILSICLCKKG